ncbi:MAG: hypothetical protein NWQ54_22455 [Paraglaciecola sp.]|nr:hypothetical protein [Paraglaciecola sp.]
MLKRQRFHAIILFVLTLVITACASQAPSPTNTTLRLPTPLYGHAVANNGKHIFVLGGANKEGFSRDIVIIDPATQSVKQLKDKLLPRRYHSAVWDGADLIYVLGGVSNWKNRSRLQPLVEVYNIRTQEVKIIGEMPVPRRFGSAVLLDGKIIVSGGGVWSRQTRNKLVPTNTVAIYDINNDSWKKGADLPDKESTRAVVLGEHIYTVGGFNGKTPSSHFYRYDLALDSWTELAELPQPLSAHSAVASKSKIYTFGDYTNLNSAYVFDATSSTWQLAPFTLEASRHNAATILNGNIYVLGGTIGSNGPFLDTIQIFPVNEN